MLSVIWERAPPRNINVGGHCDSQAVGSFQWLNVSFLFCSETLEKSFQADFTDVNKHCIQPLVFLPVAESCRAEAFQTGSKSVAR